MTPRRDRPRRGHLRPRHRCRENSRKQPLFPTRNVAMVAGGEETSQCPRRPVRGTPRPVREEGRGGVDVRGPAAVSDFEYEFRWRSPIETCPISPPSPDAARKYTYLNSSIVREISRLGGNERVRTPPSGGCREVNVAPGGNGDDPFPENRVGGGIPDARVPGWQTVEGAGVDISMTAANPTSPRRNTSRRPRSPPSATTSPITRRMQGFRN